MRIHVVQPGDTVWELSRRYGVSMDRITQVNQLNDIPGLVIGQALVIPSEERPYRVQPGDSLWSIAQRYGVSVGSIAALNNLTPPFALSPGQVLRIPELAKNYGTVEVNGYIEPSTREEEERIVRSVGQFHTYISPFSYQVGEDGSLSSLQDETIIRTARQLRVASLMVITNFRGGTFDTDLGHAILTSQTAQQNLINNVLSTIRTKGYYGLNIDFERIDPADRELYNDFLRKVVAALRPNGYVVSTALAPKTSGAQTGAWYEAHDYPAHGQIVDFVILMTYEWGWSGGPPMAVAPIRQVRAVVDYALTVIPANKIMIGVPLYGYDWTLPYLPHGGWARRVSPQDAYRTAYRYGAAVQYDQEAQAPFFYYYDRNGAQHVIWFEDARSVQEKYRLVSDRGLRGVSYWVLGQEFPQNWAVLNDMFNIVKVI